MKAQAFVAITNVRRVLRDVNDPASAIDRFTPSQARAFALTDACRSGMKPKVLAAANAVTAGAVASYICAVAPADLGRTLRGRRDGRTRLNRAARIDARPVVPSWQK